MLNKLPEPITYREVLMTLADKYLDEECPRCHKNRYGLAQHKCCPDCAYTGSGRDSALDRVRVGEN